MNSTSAVIVRSLLLGTSCLAVVSISSAIAQPHGGTVAAGSATISGGANLTTINQTTNKAVINWQSFSVAAGGTVQFNQLGAKSVTLNRVTGPDASAINGAINANGQVWIINGNGILFGKGAQVNVGGLIATTSDIADGDFMSGTNSFSGGTGASVVNQGTIRARSGGSVVMSGAHVSNEGLIQADAGTVVLGGASAFTVDFDGDNLLRYAITAPAGQASVSNSGTIQANSGGHVVLTARAAEAVADNVVNNSGMISATSAKTENGEVVLDGGAGGTVNVSGAVTATGNGAGQTGGTVAITGSTVRVADNATIDASGNAGGGTVNVGGNAHGQGPLQNADNTSVGNALIKADATRTSNGGTVVVWSNGLTDFSGIISAIGGAVSGDGGFVETSGHNLRVAPTATVDTHAPKGSTGTWLLDPDDLIIQTGGSSTLNGGSILLTDNPGGTSVVDPATITAALATTDVTLEAAQQLNVEDPVVYTSSHALNLLSEGTVGIDNSIQNAGTGAITIVSGWNGTTAPGAIVTTPGSYGRLDVNSSPYSLTLSSGEGGPDVEVGSKGGLTTIAGGTIDLSNFGNGSVQIGYHGAGATGAIIVRAAGSVSLDGNVGDVLIGNGSLSSDVTGPISGNIDVRSASTININQSGGSAWIGNGTATANAETGNVTLIAGDNNSSSNVDITTLISADLQGGDFLLGSTDTTPTEVAALSYSSPHTLSFLAAGDLEISGDLLNTGSGAINLVAGWDGTTVAPASFGNPGAFGLNDAILSVGGSSATGPVAVGSASGATSAYAADVIVDADSASAQFGYRGAGTGALTIATTDSVSVLASASNAYAVIGNGDNGTSANGAITILAPNGVSVATTGTSDAAKIGNGLNNSSGTVGGHILIAAGTGTVGVVNTGSTGYAQIGNGGDGNTGDISGVVTVNAGNVIVSTSGSNEFAFIGNGNAHSSGTVTGDVNVTATTVSLVAGGDTQTVKIGNGTDFSSYAVSGNVTVTANLVTMSATAGGAAVQIGNGAHDDTGSATGTITVNTGSLVMSTAAANEYVLLGTGGVGDTGALSGNINVFASGGASLSSFDPTSPSVYIAHLGNATGDVTVVANQITGIDPSFSAVSDGDFVLEVTGTSGFTASSQDNIFSGSHNLYILSAGPVSIPGKIENTGTGGITIDAGWDTDTTDLNQLQAPGAFGNNGAGLTIGGSSGGVAVGSVGGPLVLLASTLTLDGSAGYAQAGYHGAGGGAITIATTGDIVMSASGHDTMIGNGSMGTDVTGNVTGDITITAAGQTSFLNTSGGTNWIGNRTSSGSETGNVILVTDSTDNEQGCSISCFATADLVGGDFTIGYTGLAAEGNNDGPGAYNSGHTLNILAAGNLAILNSVQNAGSGTINVLSGWDGRTLDPTQFGNVGVYGNNSAGFLVGGATANGSVAIGSAGGPLNIYGNNVLANAVNGYAQMGFHGAGAGTILLHTLGTVTLDGGASSGLYAQIGNGGLGTVGSNSGSVTVTAGGDLTLAAGTGDASYAQIGHGGAESNPNSSAYSNNALITVTAADVILDGGSLEAYAQIGNGGFRAGEGLTGTALNGGDITVNASHNVTLAAGSGTTAYAQIGNGGGQSNLNPGSSASGVDSGDIVVTAPNGTAGSVTLTAGTGANSYAQIGNGGYDANGTTATVSSVNFSMMGNVTVSDLALKGGDSNANSYAQIGEGDASLNSLGNVSGAIVTNTGGVPTTLTNGLASHSPAEIGNFTGDGTGSGGSSGGGSGGGGSGGGGSGGGGSGGGGSGGGGSGGGGDGGGGSGGDGSVIDDPTTHGAIVSSVQPSPSKGTVITTIVLTDVAPGDTGAVTVIEQLGPIAELTGNSGEPPTPSDGATIVIAQSLDGAHKPPAGQPLIGSMLKRNDSSDDQHGTPPADQNISSWGNEALWQ